MSSNAFIEEDKVSHHTDRRLALRLVEFIKPYWKLIVLSSIMSLVMSLLQLAGPFIVKIIIDDHIAIGNFNGVTGLSALFMLSIVALFACEYVQGWLIAYVGQRSMFDLRARLFEHVQKLSLSFFDRNPVGRLMTRITSDVAALNELFSQGIMTLAGDIFLLIAIAAILIKTNLILALLLFSVGPFLLVAAAIFRRKVRASFREVRLSLSRMNAFLQENLSGIRTIQAYNRERLNHEKFANLNEHYRQENVKTVVYYAVFLPIVEVISAVAIGLIVWYGGGASLRGSISLGTVVLFIQFSQRFFQPIKDLTEKFNIFQTAMASAERVFKLLDTEPDVVSPASPVALEKFQHDIEFRNVWFAYKDEQWVLQDLSFRVRRGETVALVGATGSGKSTIIGLLSRFYDVQKGSILIDGTDIREFDQYALRRQMAVVLQDNFLFTGDISSNIRLGNEDITDEKVRQCAEFVNADHFIQSLPDKYQAEVLERGATLSVGQKQLLAFARALAFDPSILILDEATASIDTETELLIQDALQKLLHGRTSIVIAHRLSTIQKADNIIVLSHGRIREQGTHSQLLQLDGTYRKLYELQYNAVADKVGGGMNMDDAEEAG